MTGNYQNGHVKILEQMGNYKPVLFLWNSSKSGISLAQMDRDWKGAISLGLNNKMLIEGILQTLKIHQNQNQNLP